MLWPSFEKYKSFYVKTLCRLLLLLNFFFPLFGFHLKNVSCYFLIFRDLSSNSVHKAKHKNIKGIIISSDFFATSKLILCLSQPFFSKRIAFVMSRFCKILHCSFHQNTLLGYKKDTFILHFSGVAKVQNLIIVLWFFEIL